jgi:hypothetical protein
MTLFPFRSLTKSKNIGWLLRHGPKEPVRAKKGPVVNRAFSKRALTFFPRAAKPLVGEDGR